MNFTYYPILLLFLTGCYSSGVMQTAKPLNKGKISYTGGISGYNMDDEIYAGPEFMIRKGINSKSDFGFGYALGLYGHAYADYKYVLVESAAKKNYLSSGIGLDAFIPSDFQDFPWMIGMKLPFYASFNHNKNTIPYFAQSFTLGLNDIAILSHLSDNKANSSTIYYDHSIYYSGGAGVQFVKKNINYFIEGSYSILMNNIYRNFYDNNLNDWYLEKRFYRVFNYQLMFGIVFKSTNKK